MGILLYLLSLQERVLRQLDVICLRNMLGRLGQGNLLNPGAIISFPIMYPWGMTFQSHPALISGHRTKVPMPLVTVVQ